MSAVHVLKTWPEHFADVENAGARKTFELRRDDRGFVPGDLLALVEFEPLSGDYSGQIAYREITHMLKGFAGIEPGFTILSLGLLLQCCDSEKLQRCREAVERYFEQTETIATAAP